MDLNHIELPASVIADLYADSLVNDPGMIEEPSVINKPIKDQPSIVAEDEMSPFRSLGNNNKSVLIIVNNPDAVHLPDDELQFLAGILGACKLTLEDVAIVNLNNHPGTLYKELTTHFKSRIVFLFDVEPAAFGLPMSFPYYQIQAFAGNSFLYSPSLKQLENDRVEKSKLWVCLKRLFNL